MIRRGSLADTLAATRATPEELVAQIEQRAQAANRRREALSTAEGVLAALEHPEDHGFERVQGRTLLKGLQWSGHDVPGRGKAAQRRLRQLEKQKEKEKPA